MSDVASVSVDKRKATIQQKEVVAERRRRYDQRRVYLGEAAGEWERQRTIFGKSHSLFAAHLLGKHAGRPL